MLNAVITWSLRHRFLVILASIGLSLAGILAFRRLPIDAFPDTTPVQVQINTVAPALSPVEIERQITAPVEQAISGLPRLEEVRSLSRFGLSQVTARFEDDTDIYLARQVVMERLQTVTLPPGIHRPELGPVATGLGEVFHYVVTGKGKSLSELRAVHDWVIAPQLRSVRGVAEVNAWGGDERQIQVLVDPAELTARGLSLHDLSEALERNNANVGGGNLDQAGESSLIQGIGIATRVSDIEDIVVAAKGGVPIRVRDVARVVEGREIRRGAVTADGQGEVVLGLGFMLMGENSHDVTTRLKARLSEVEKSLPPGVDVAVVYDRTELIDRVLGTVEKNLLEGALLVVAVLFAFLGNLRAGLIVASAIPLSMLFAFDLMLRAGVAGSLMSLGAIDFGLVVDSSVIMVENSVRRLSEDASDRSTTDVVRDASIEVRKPTMFGELIIMIVYLPILALEGAEGKLFRPMALTVIFALIGSMILSLTLMPALASLLLPRRMKERENVLVRLLKRAYRPALQLALRWRWAVLAGAALLLGNAAFLATRLGAEFVPRLREGTLVANTVRLSGVSAGESIRYGTRLERVLLDRFPDEIERVWTRTGTAEVATDPMGLELSDMFITLKPREAWKRAATQDELVQAMESELAGMPGMRVIYTQPIEMRVNEMVAGIRADLGVKLFGDDFDTLKQKAREIEAALKKIPGAADVVTEQVTGQPVLEIEVDRAAIARHGIAAADVLDVVEALGAREVGQLQEGERRFPVVLRIDDRYREDPASIGRILVTAAGGERIPLARLAKIRTTEGPAAINREWAKRRIVVQANVRGRDVGTFVEEARARLDEVELPPGYYVRFGGQFEHLERAQARLLVVVPIALGLILLLLYFTYGRLLDAVRVFTGVPFAAIGGVVALWLRDLPFSISAGVGFVALSGVAVLGDMVLVSTIRQLTAAGTPVRDAIELAAERRLRPVLMTALVASLGFVPMALNTGVGAEVQRPLATVVIGGVISSTLLTLLVLPALYSVVGGGLRADAAGEAGASEPPRRAGPALSPAAE
ncbi:cobalt/zinc/cadmium efflux RND transporter,permease protein, CzcA family [Sorangium cellulosum So ce56]|uniref:Cobalt/zinc/cadmium efflux RND transporter,permease protein, CzcA family n=1 Tax=Sorangium cellulosum (strain So ce56) TaxID=448385 RepID=A9GAQ5_SORC5|nr:CusA/CzcA family heavy metal efflux RND transporter [Sorangium cellulosum]CAN92896.1 cobalt/zinc/cadmium efflux RND transporter,permease protein, CzcA family [Sorangium cellulosum So ce56]